MVAPAVIAAGASLAAGGLNFAGGAQANRMSRKIVREQMDFQAKQTRQQMAFQTEMSNTAYQRAMADMEKAGLNPILAYQQGGASTPTGAGGSGASVAQQNELAGAVSSAIDVKRAFAEIANLREQNKKLKSDTDISKAEAKLLEAQIPGANVEKAIDSSRYAPAIRFIQRIIPWVNSAKGVFSNTRR